MPWEKLPAEMSKRSEMPAISLQKGGRVAWNEGTNKSLGEPDFVELLIDRKTMRLGLRKSIKGAGNFPVRRVGSQRTWMINAAGTLGLVGLLVDTAYRRYAEVDDDIVFIDISELFSDQDS
jgi:hypothetical protein